MTEHADAVRAFYAGRASAFDQAGAQAAAERPGEAVTAQVSWWNHLVCTTCGHTFRRGDRVWRDSADWTVYHLDPDRMLGCGGPHGTAEHERPQSAQVPEASQSAEFAAGVDEVWPLDDGMSAVTLGPDDWRVKRPPPPLTRARCLFCAHTFRPGERVVVCPCRAGLPACGAAVHRHPAAGLVCWESWRPSGDVILCPITSARPGMRPGW